MYCYMCGARPNSLNEPDGFSNSCVLRSGAEIFYFLKSF